MWEKIDDCTLKSFAHSVPAQENYTPILFVPIVIKPAQLMSRPI